MDVSSQLYFGFQFGIIKRNSDLWPAIRFSPLSSVVREGRL